MIFIDTSGWTQDQINHIPAVAYLIAFQSGQDVVPKWDGINLDFGGADLSKVVTSQTILDGIASEQSKRDLAATQYQSDLSTYNTLKQTINSVDTASLSPIPVTMNQIIQYLQLKDKLRVR